jgi:iron complex outermembrane recepter protein
MNTSSPEHPPKAAYPGEYEKKGVGMKRFSIGIVAVVTFCLAIQVPAFAEEPYRLEDVIVTASRTKTPLAEAPADVTVIKADEIAEMGAQTLIDVFQREPGVFTQNLFGNPKQSVVDIRGYGEAAPQNSLVLVNGRRANNIDLSGSDLAQIPVSAIERIEIYRGPASVLYGDNATGGVINIILRSGEGPPKVTTAMTVGSYNFFKPELTISGKQGKFSYLVLASDIETSGYRHNNALYANDATGNFGFDVCRNLTLRASAGHHRDSYGQTGALLRFNELRKGLEDPKDSTHPDDNAATEDSFVDLQPEIKLHDKVALTVGGSYRDRHISSLNKFTGGFTELMSQLQTYGFTPKVLITAPLAGLRNEVAVGMDYYKYDQGTGTAGDFLGSPSSTKSNIEKLDFAYYANERFYPVNDLVLEAGYRKQKTKYDINFRDYVTRGVSLRSSTRYEREAYRFSANYGIFDKANVFASYGRGFRFPTTDEIVIPGFGLGPDTPPIPTTINRNLLPQTTREFDAGLRWNPWYRLSGMITYFQSRDEDEIFFNSAMYENQNYARTRREGVESSVFFNMAKGLTLNVTYSYTEAKFGGGQFTDDWIPLVPRNKASAKLAYACGDWDFSIASIYNGDRYAISDQANAQEKLAGYTTYDASIGYRFKKLRALLNVRNLTAKRYAEYGVFSFFRNDVGLYASPGRQFFVRLEYEI